MKVTFGERAYSDLAEIEAYILDRSDPETATYYVDRILNYCEALTEFPRRGTPRDDLRAGIRSLSFEGRLIIFYRIDGPTVRVLRIIHGARQLGALQLDT